MKSKEKVKANLIKNSVKLLNINIQAYLKQVAENGNTQDVLSFIQEIEEKFLVQMKKGED